MRHHKVDCDWTVGIDFRVNPFRSWRAGVLVSTALILHSAVDGAPVAIRNPEPFPAIIALAKQRDIPLDGFDSPRRGQALVPGDRFTALFTLTENGTVRQWLADVHIVPLTGAEQREKPADTTIYTSSGNEFHLTSKPAAFSLTMYGPITADALEAASVASKQAHFLVKEDFLSFGFDRMCELALRLRKMNEDIRMGFTTGPWAADQLAWGKAWTQRVGFTHDDELVCAKQSFATLEFLLLADRTPGLRDIVQASVKRPSLLTALRKRNFGLFFTYDWPNLQVVESSRLSPSGTVYDLPFSLTEFGSHVANGSWRVTRAQPPLLACAGIVSLAIEPPDANGKHLDLQVIAARNGEAVANKE